VTAPRSWPAPAKLNLFLHILGRRPDGYHNLQTVFQFLDHGDDLFFESRPDGQVRRGVALQGVPEADDLSVRAALALKARTHCPLGCDIRIEKHIPLGGGLGGGSSDAATTLVALNHIWNLKLPDDDLAAIGLTLGADVPVFVRGFAAWAEGVGDKLMPVMPPEPWYLVLTPPCAVSTREIFQAPELPRSTKPITPADFAAGKARNDCLETVRARYPLVGEALDWLSRFGAARLSGTGASVFAAFSQKTEALKIQALAPGAWRSFVARGHHRSPLRTALDGYNPRPQSFPALRTRGEG
jgi:4-diphosphocytidyl-2-C-methyl-D-erythritol kinase